ncbi:hypothetical protein OsJ_23552 [Oryza sativa Japonica Group]|uniref:Chalcone/stilbene synthase N-terminal domain-containing protein n=1 Tax=Oryza sativa subsp. japonica TaxID=39947 RepID=B9FW66_ORYSJ|nr:hypothetical protein OsJ_23552 [Oryza sativa Japonica Group]
MVTSTVKLEEVRRMQRAEGMAAVLAIGTATPANCVYQTDYPDYYFRASISTSVCVSVFVTVVT